MGRKRLNLLTSWPEARARTPLTDRVIALGDEVAAAVDLPVGLEDEV